jgi:hypothetical protein
MLPFVVVRWSLAGRRTVAADPRYRHRVPERPGLLRLVQSPPKVGDGESECDDLAFEARLLGAESGEFVAAVAAGQQAHHDAPPK